MRTKNNLTSSLWRYGKDLFQPYNAMDGESAHMEKIRLEIAMYLR